jgi:hypothetical protein
MKKKIPPLNGFAHALGFIKQLITEDKTLQTEFNDQ